MRFSRPISVPAGGEWPNSEGGLALRRFRWLLVENRALYGSGLDVYVSLTDRSSATDPSSWFLTVPAGTRRVRSIAGSKAPEVEALKLRILNPGSAAVTCWVETDDEPIIDFGESLAPAGEGLAVALTPAGADQVEVSVSTAVGAAIAASIPAAAGLTSWITGFDCTLGIPAAAATALLTVDGPADALDYAVTASLAAGGAASVRFPAPIPAAAADTAISVNLPAIGGGAAVNALTVFGYQK